MAVQRPFRPEVPHPIRPFTNPQVFEHLDLLPSRGVNSAQNRKTQKVALSTLDALPTIRKLTLLPPPHAILDCQKCQARVTATYVGVYSLSHGESFTRFDPWVLLYPTPPSIDNVWRLLYQRDGRDACAPLDAQMRLGERLGIWAWV